MNERKPVDRLDSGESIFFKRQLEYIKAKTYDEVLADLKYAQLIPITSEVPQGATEMTWRSYKSYGFAKFISDYATDFPRVELGGTENTVKIKDIGVSYAYTIKDIRRAAYANIDLSSRKALAARRAIEEKLNQVAWFGDTTAGIQPFIKYPGTTQYTVPATGTGSTTTWSTKTPDQILVDLNGIMNAVVIPTFGKETVDTILLPITQMSLIKNTRMGTYNDTTIYEFFTRNNPGINLEVVREVAGAGTGGKDVFIAYKKDPDVIAFELPVAFEQLEMDKEGMEYVTPCMASVAGTICYRPAAVAWGEGL